MRTRPAPRAFSSARILLGLMLFAAPLPYGAVYGWAWASLSILTLLALILWMKGSIGENRLKIGWSPLYLSLALFLVLGWVQLIFHTTIAPIATRESLLQLATCAVLFFVVIQLFAGAAVETWRRVGVAVLAFGSIFSFLSILQFLWNPTRIVWIDHNLGGPFGPYVDRDHYAGLMEMVIPVSASFVLSRPKRDPLNGMLWFGVLVTIVSALLTGSRGGLVSILVEAAILGWILVRRDPVRARRRRIATTGLALAVMAVLFFWLVPSFVLTKIGTVESYSSETKEGERPTLWRNSLGIFREHPWLGAGMGSFETAYPPHQSQANDLVTEHAHNDYVEALAETGLLGGVLILVALVFFFRSFRNLVVQAEDELGWIQLGATVACCGLLVHSFVDFNLHIPANAAWFAFCAGLASLSPEAFPGLPGAEE